MQDVSQMLSALLTSNLQALETLQDLTEKVDANQAVTKLDVESVISNELQPVHAKLDKANSTITTIDTKVTNIQNEQKQVQQLVVEMDQHLAVAIQGITALLNGDSEAPTDVETIISEYESEHIQQIVDAMVTTQNNVQKMATALKSINQEMTHLKTEVTDLNDVYIDTNARMKAMELPQTEVSITEPTSLNDSINELRKFIN